MHQSRHLRQAPRVLATSAAALVGLLSLLPATGSAANIAWSNTSPDPVDWLSGLSWMGGFVPGSLDAAIFSNTVSGGSLIGLDFSGATNNGAANQAIGSILLNGASDRTLGASTATNGVLTLQGASGVLLGNSGAGNLNIGPSLSGATGSLALNLASAGALDISGSGNITIGAVITGTNGLTKTGAGAGVLTLSGANAYTGTTSVAAGKLVLDFSPATAPASNIINSASVLALGGGGSASALSLIAKADAPTTQTFAGLTLNAGASSVTSTANGATNPLPLNLGAITRATGSSVAFTQPSGSVGATNGYTTTTANTSGSGADAILGGWATVGNNWATNNGTNIVAFSGYYTTTTGLNVAANYAGKNLQVNSAPIFDGAITPNSIYLANTTARVITLTGANVVASGGFLVSSAATTAGTFTGGTITSGNGQDLIVIHNGSANLVINSAIINNGSTFIGLTKSGSGQLNLGAANSYTGPTNVNEGTLALAINNAINAGSSIFINGGTLTLNNNITDTVSGVSLRNGSIVGTNAASALTSSTAYDLQNGSVSAILAGTAGAVKTTAGTVTISRVATYTGGTQIKAGTIKLGLAAALATQAVTLGDATANTGGTLDLNGFAQTLTSIVNAGTGASIITNSSATAATFGLNGTGTNFSGVIQDGAGQVALTVSSSGTATLSGANTYTGQTLVQNAVLTLKGGDNRLAASNAVALNNNGRLVLGDASGASNQTLSSLTIGAAGTTNRVLGGNATQTSVLTINNAASVVFAGGAASSGYLGTGTADTAAVTANNNLALVKNGAGTFTLGGGLAGPLSTYVGGTTINAGTLALGVANALPGAKTLTYGAGTLSSGAVTINGGTLDLAGFSTVAGLVTLNGGSIASTGTTATLSGTGYAVQGGTISAILGNGASPSALTKTGSGTVTLNAANTYTGGTNINGGTLALGIANALPTTGAVNIAGGLLDLGGYDTTIGTLTLTSGGIVNAGGAATLTGSSYAVQSGTINAALGGSGALTKTTSGTVLLTAANTYTGATTVSAGTLGVSALQTGGGAFSVADAATLKVSLGGAGQSLATSGLTLGTATGGTLSFDLGTFGLPSTPVISAGPLTLNGTNTINVTAAGLGVGSFSLIAYTGALGGTGSLVLGTLPARITASLDLLTQPQNVVLKITGFDTPRWTGAASGAWDIDDGTGAVGALNWKLSNNAATGYYQGGAAGTDSVIFDDTAATGSARTVNLTTVLTPNGITVNNTAGAANAYTFNGTGKLSGTTTLTKQGTGTLILANSGANDFTGAITITGGIVQAGDGTNAGRGQLGTGNVALSSGGTLALNRPVGDDFALANALSGAGTLSKQGGNIVTLTGNNLAFSGAFDVSAGTLKVGSNNALGTAAGALQSGTTLDLTGYDVDNSLTIKGATVKASSGTVSALSGLVTLNGGGTTDVASGATLTVSGILGGTGGLTKSNAGLLILSGNNSYAGTTAISAGTVQLGHANALGSAADGTTVAAGATLDLAGFVTADAVTLNGSTLTGTGGVSGAVTLGAGGGLVNIGSGNLTLSGAATGAGSLTKNGAGTLSLSGANDFAGGTVLNAGTLHFAQAAAVPATGAIAPAAGTTVSYGFALDQTSLGRINPTANAFVVALAADSANSLDFSDYSGASLGAIGSATYSGTLTPSGSTYRLGAGGLLIISGALTGSNAVSVNTTASGALTLSGTNTYTGGTTITTGTLKLGSATALGASSSAFTVNGGTVDLNGFNTTVGSLTGLTGGVIKDNSTTPGITYLTDNIATGSSTYTGSITDGAVRQVALIKTGAGTLLLNQGNGNTHTGGTFINGGTLELRINNAQILAASSNLSFTGTSTFLVNDNSAVAANLSISGLSFTAGLGTVTVTTSTAPSATATFTGTVTRANGAAGIFTVGTGFSGPAFRTILAGPTVPVNQLLNAGLYYLGTDFAVSDSSSAIGLRALNYSVDTNGANVSLSTDTATLGGAGAKDVQLGGTGSISAQTDLALNSLKIAGANSVTLDTGAILTISSGGLLKSGGNAATISGGVGLTTGGASDLVIRNVAATDALTIATDILSTTTGGVTKSGAGTLLLSGNNAYSGTTTILQGTLQIGSAHALGSAADGTLVSTGATLDVAGLTTAEPVQINGGTLHSGTGAGGTVSGAVTLIGNGNVSAAANATLTLSGALSGTGSLTKTVAGTVILTGTNTYTGGTTVSVGALVFGTAASIPATGFVAPVASSTVGFGFALDQTALDHVGATSNAFTIALAANSANALDFTNYSAGRLGALGTATYSGTLTPNGTTYRLGNTGALTVTGALTGANALSVATSGTGSVTLSGANTLTGGTTVAGVLKLGSTSALGASTSPLTLTSGTVDLNGFNTSVGVLTGAAGGVITDNASGSGTTTLTVNQTATGTFTGNLNDGATRSLALTKAGPDVLVVSGTNTFSGLTTISAGSLRAGSATALGSATNGTIINGTGTLDVFAKNLGIEAVTVSGSGVGGNGAIVNSSTQQLNALRFVTLGGDATFGGTGRWDVRGTGTAGTASLDLAGHKLTKTGSNQISFVNTVVGQGDIDVNQGLLSFEAGSTVAGSGTITVNGGGTLQVGQFGIGNNVSRAITLAGGTLAGGGSATQAAIVLSPITLASGTTSTISNATSIFSLTGGISGPGNLIVTNAGATPITITTVAGNVIGGSLTTSGAVWNIAGNGTTGALGINGAVALNGGTMAFDLSANPAAGNDQVQLASDLTLTGTTNISITPIAGTLGAGSYTLLTGATSLVGDTTNLALANVPANTRQTLALDTTTAAGKLLLKVTGSAADLKWAGPGTWDTNTTANWTNAAAADKFFSWDRVTFDDTATNGVVVLASSVTPGALLINNSTTTYSITGSGGVIAGTGGLLKTGSGVLTLGTLNTYSGGSVIRAGEVRIYNASALGTGTVTLGDASTGTSNVALYLENNRTSFARAIAVTANGTGTVTIGSRSTVVGSGDTNNFLSIALARDVIFDSNAANRTDYRNITGTGNILVIGAGRTILGGTNTFTGNLTVSTNGAGLLQVGAGEVALTNFIPDTSSVTINGGAVFSLGSASEAIDALKGIGRINVSGIDGTLIVGVSGGSGEYTGILEDQTPNKLALTKAGAGTETLAGFNTYTGPTTVTAGTLEITGSLTATSSLNVNGGTLRLGATEHLNDAAALQLAGGTFQTGGFSETLGQLTLAANSTIDFGAGAGSLLQFSAFGSHTAGAVLSLENWSGTLGLAGDANSDRLVFAGQISDFTSVFGQNDLRFNGMPGYLAVPVDSGSYEIVAVPEPATVSLFVSGLLVGLASRRPRRNLGLRVAEEA